MDATLLSIRKKSFRKKVAYIIFTLLCGISQLHAATITSTAKGGLWGDKSTWIGGNVPTKTDDVVITSEVRTGDFYYSSGQYDMVNLTIQSGGKIIREADEVGRCLLVVSGNLINNGEILDFKDFFDIEVYGNLQNNGILKPRLLYLLGQNQQISGSKPISPKTLGLQMTDTFLTAASDLHFHNCDVTGNSGKSLNMKNFKLKLSADSITYSTYYGQVGSACEVRVPLQFEQNGTIEIDKALIGKTIQGNVLLKSPSYAFLKDLTVEGNFTIEAGTKVSSHHNSTRLTVKGNFTNYGLLNNDTIQVSNLKIAPRALYFIIYGNSYNFGSTGISKILLTTNGNTLNIKGNYTNDVKFQQAEGNETPGGKVLINDEVKIDGKLEVYSTLEISPGGKLDLRSPTSSYLYIYKGKGQIINNGNMYRYHEVSSWFYDRSYSDQPGTFVDFELREREGTFDKIDIEVHNGTTYPGLPGSTLRWWRLKSLGEGKIKYYTIKLYYDENLLNGQKEENLNVYHSTDNGETWEVVSVGEYAIRDTVNNFISIGLWSKNESMLTEFGDFVISSGDGSVPVPSNIIVNLTGSNGIRLGAPNRYTVHISNTANTRVYSLLAAVTVTDEIVFKQIEMPTKSGKDIYPIDSIGTPQDDIQLFYIPYLEPNEEYSFDVIVVGVNKGTKSASEEDPEIVAVCLKEASAKDGVENYVVDKINEPAKFTPEEEKEWKNMLGLTDEQYKNLKEKEGKGAAPLKSVIKHSVELASRTNPLTSIAFKVGNAIEFVSKLAPTYRRRIFYWFAKQTDPKYDKKIEVVDGKKLQGEIRKSWDPNEKLGLVGYSKSNYISSAGKMYYTIAFENKKEATAPAYRVQIVDTLSAVFDPETVKFGATSHSGTNYKWKMERNGTIIKWDIEGIELLPNITPPEGEGFVRFSVELDEGLPSGTTIENRATIIFDLNEPITTNTWINVLDTVAPKTTMVPINYSSGDKLVNVECNATDHQNGSGIGKHDFYVSVNNGPFAFIGESFGSSIPFEVSDTTRNNYRFFAMTTDNVGNVEKSIPAMSELNTLLVSAPRPMINSSGITVYPNPINDVFYINFKAEAGTDSYLRLYSAEGKLLKIFNRNHYDEGYHRAVFDLVSFEPGIYIAEFILGDKIQTFRVVKK